MIAQPWEPTWAQGRAPVRVEPPAPQARSPKNERDDRRFDRAPANRRGQEVQTPSTPGEKRRTSGSSRCGGGEAVAVAPARRGNHGHERFEHSSTPPRGAIQSALPAPPWAGEALSAVTRRAVGREDSRIASTRALSAAKAVNPRRDRALRHKYCSAVIPGLCTGGPNATGFSDRTFRRD